VALVALAASVMAQEAAEDNRSSRVDYRIEARLDGETKELDGRETILWTNRSQDTVSDLWFHLYLNAFSNNYSTHLWETKGRARGRDFKEGWGWQRITSLRVEGEELAGNIRFRSPDDGREDDRTVFSVDLPRPVAPGETLAIEIEWESQLPRVRRRTGYKGNFLLVAQWYPKLGVYEGGRGWNCHQFHESTEFYGDFGTYDVTLDLPVEYRDKVGASGVQEGAAVVNGDRVLTRFLAPSLGDRQAADQFGKHALVHDFTWTADPDFVVIEDTFQFARWAGKHAAELQATAAALGMEPESVRLRDVVVRILMQPERARRQWKRHFDATCTALFFYGLWFGEYPYEQVTVVDPAWGAGAAGGMEYPTLFTCGTQLYTRKQMHRPESVTVHEAGHQFWYGLVGNNEFEAAWLDEGFNSYTDSEAIWRQYGARRAATWYSGLPAWGVSPARRPGGGRLGDILTATKWKLPFGFELEPLGESGFIDWWRDQPRLTFVEQLDDPRWGDRGGYLADPDSDPIDTAAWGYVDRQSYRTNSYPRTAVALRSLSAVIGRDAFLRGMRHYAKTWRYRHPYPDDFFQTFSEGAGVDVSWYFEDVFRGTGTVDWSVDVQQRKTPKRKGWFMDAEGVFTKAPATDDDDDDNDEDEEEDDDERDSGPADPDWPWIYNVTLRRNGELRLPVTVEVVFADGSREPFEWTREMQAGSNWWRLPLAPGVEKIASVVIDPERLYYFDENMTDNQWYEEVDSLVPLRWSERIVTQYSHLLHWFGTTGG